MRQRQSDYEQEDSGALIELGAATELTQGPPGQEAEEVILLGREEA